MCGAFGLKNEKRRERIAELTELLGLESVLKKKAGKLSGGWQRRLSIAMALVGQPQILFLDEPTLGLDVLARSDLWKIIKALRGRVTVILTTHYMEEAEELCDRVAIMADGRLLAIDTPEGFKQKTGTERFEEAFVKIVKGEVQL
jgi:ABC-2 type transport system ATP-binding protein